MMKTKGLRALTALLQELRRIDPEFPLQYALCLTEIAQQEGLSLTELAQRTGISLSTVSRIIGNLSSRRARCGELVKIGFSTTEARRKELWLTPSGAALLYRLVENIENSRPAPKTELKTG